MSQAHMCLITLDTYYNKTINLLDTYEKFLKKVMKTVNQTTSKKGKSSKKQTESQLKK